MATKQQEFSVHKAKESDFEGGGLRDFFVYRDLGIAKATQGGFGAQVIRAAKAVEAPMGKHRHELGFQMVYILKGSCVFWYEGQGSFELEPGDCVYQPPGIAHEFVSCSDDLELIEITMPADFPTEDA
ncbi:MAG: cupin domain-containing protein [Rhodovibrionaceae bacterium]